jgi:hypothetical protein
MLNAVVLRIITLNVIMLGVFMLSYTGHYYTECHCAGILYAQSGYKSEYAESYYTEYWKSLC